MFIFLTWFILSLIVASAGDSRVIGFWAALFLSLFLSPLVGFIVVLLSERKSDIAHKRKMEELTETQIRVQTGNLTTEEKAKLYDQMMDKKKS